MWLGKYKSNWRSNRSDTVDIRRFDGWLNSTTDSRLSINPGRSLSLLPVAPSVIDRYPMAWTGFGIPKMGTLLLDRMACAGPICSVFPDDDIPGLDAFRGRLCLEDLDDSVFPATHPTSDAGMGFVTVNSSLGGRQGDESRARQQFRQKPVSELPSRDCR